MTQPAIPTTTRALLEIAGRVESVWRQNQTVGTCTRMIPPMVGPASATNPCTNVHGSNARSQVGSIHRTMVTPMPAMTMRAANSRARSSLTCVASCMLTRMAATKMVAAPDERDR